MGNLRAVAGVQFDVEANADDGVSHVSALQGVFDEQAAYFSTANENVVGPLDGRVEAGLRFDGTSDGQGGENADEGQRLQGGSQHDGEDEVARRGNPDAVEPAPSSGLAVAEDHGTVGGAAFSFPSGPVHGGIQLFEVEDSASDNLGVETLLQGLWNQVIGCLLLSQRPLPVVSIRLDGLPVERRGRVSKFRWGW